MKRILHNWTLNGQYCVTFQEISRDTVTQSFACYPTKHKALLEMGIFEHADIWRALA